MYESRTFRPVTGQTENRVVSKRLTPTLTPDEPSKDGSDGWKRVAYILMPISDETDKEDHLGTPTPESLDGLQERTETRQSYVAGGTSARHGVGQRAAEMVHSPCTQTCDSEHGVVKI